jgi:hypothetical protein
VGDIGGGEQDVGAEIAGPGGDKAAGGLPAGAGAR